MPSRRAPVVTCLFDGEEAPWLQPVVVQRSAHGGVSDHAIVQVDRAYTGTTLEDLSLQPDSTKSLEIIGAVDDTRRVLFFGVTAGTNITISPRGEVQSLTFRLDRWCFGHPYWGQFVWDPSSDTVRHVDRDIVFNPIFNGRVWGNSRSDHPQGKAQTALFLDPDSVRTNHAELYQSGTLGEQPRFWTLGDVVLYLCWRANSQETYIPNPSRDEIESLFSDPRDHIRDLRLRPGLYLPELLDAVLEPFGYSWFVELIAPGKRKLSFYKRGKGRRNRYVSLQRPKSIVVAGPSKPFGSNMVSCHVSYDMSKMYNQVRGYGDFLEIEGTFLLSPGWPSSKDKLKHTRELLADDHPDFQHNRDVWRKWVLNEAGDYIGTRNLFRSAFDFRRLVSESIGANPDFAANFCVPRRRRFYPTLTVGDHGMPIGEHRGCQLEFYNSSSGSANGWQTAGSSFRVESDECAIYFSNPEKPPEEIMQLADDASQIVLRITATIRFDQRIEGFAPRLRTSPQGELAELVLDLRDRFHHRVIHPSSIYFERVRSDRLRSLEEDDRAELQSYCLQIRDAWDLAHVSGPIAIEGLDYDYELGDSITGIAGRGISFNAKASTQPRYPQVAAITYAFQDQQTTLLLDRQPESLRFTSDKQGIDNPVKAMHLAPDF